MTYRKLLEAGQPDIVRRLDIGKQYYGRAGWHFSYFGGPARIANKIRSYAHQEYNTAEYLDIDSMEASIDACKDLFGRDFIKLKHLPLGENHNLPDNYEMLLSISSKNVRENKFS